MTNEIVLYQPNEQMSLEVKLYVWNHIFSSTFRLFSKVNHSIFVSLLHTCSKLNLLQRYCENTTRSIGYFTCVRTKSAFG